LFSRRYLQHSPADRDADVSRENANELRPWFSADSSGVLAVGACFFVGLTFPPAVLFALVDYFFLVLIRAV
jgi:hypothetical protein